jgi:hypothetical protein
VSGSKESREILAWKNIIILILRIFTRVARAGERTPNIRTDDGGRIIDFLEWSAERQSWQVHREGERLNFAT